MTKKQIAAKAVEILEKTYPDAVCSLEYDQPYKLLVAVRLSAQCTDARVNLVTPVLFERFPTLQSLADANVEEIIEIVRPCGLGNSKGKSIKEMAQRLFYHYSGVVPDTMEELLTLSGVGRKSANLVLGDIYHKPAIVTDTHCIRITGRLGLTSNTEPYKVEKDLIPLINPQKSSDFCHRLVLFGREYCTARSPKCERCPLAEICKKKI